MTMQTTYGGILVADSAPYPNVNHRTVFDAAKLKELAESFRENGVLEPVVAHDRGEGETPRYWIVAGERRLRAAAIAQLVEIPAVVGHYTYAQALEVALIENLQRADPSVIDIARGFQARLDEGGTTQKELAGRVGIEQPTIANYLRLLQLPDGILKLIEDGALLPSHARDFILPFAGIPKAKWDRLTKEVEKSLRSQRSGLFGKDGALPAREVKQTVGSVARGISHSLNRSDYGQDTPQFDPKLHSECACGAPSFEYGYGGAVERCFDDAWWKAQQAAAIAKAKEREKKAAARADANVAEGGALQTYADRAALQKAHGYSVTSIGTEKGFGYTIYDLEKIPTSKLVFAKDHGGLELFCTDNAAANKASAAVRREQNALIAERRKEASAADLASARRRKTAPEKLIRYLVEQLTTDLGGDEFARTLEDLGIDVYGDSEEDAFDLAKVSDMDIMTWAKLFALKKERGDFESSAHTREDPIRKDVERELRKKYSPALRAMFKARASAGAAAAPPKNGKPAEKKKGKAAKPERELAGVGASKDPTDAVLSAADRAADAVRMSGLFNR